MKYFQLKKITYITSWRAQLWWEVVTELEICSVAAYPVSVFAVVGPLEAEGAPAMAKNVNIQNILHILKLISTYSKEFESYNHYK